ncbi:lytic transglycosylase domain-containing protein [Acinetobacter sp. HY1485]|uniref:lytic transglycosylase domain-containing protein n=1 Tax=Acinetobacter sp. HY1485 TaxID=2970918 RepID=UPI0022B97FA8|nr:lytic transglycosylase domain-containing protein [Acinetobacter sp. HY1485]
MIKKAVGFILLLPVFTWAGTTYTYKDADGGILLTDRKMNGTQYTKVNVTYYADSNMHRYQNWGKSESAVLPSYSRNKNAFDAIIKDAAQQHGLAEGLIKAVMHTESGFNTSARSPVGAQGLMQLMPATAKRFNVFNSFDPQQNIHGGAKYLSFLLKRFKGNMSLALAAYNAGEGNVQKYGGIPPFKETQDYVHRVMSRYSNLYNNGLILGSTTLSNTQIITKSAQAPTSTLSVKTQTSTKTKAREIIQLADGTFTDISVRN